MHLDISDLRPIWHIQKDIREWFWIRGEHVDTKPLSKDIKLGPALPASSAETDSPTPLWELLAVLCSNIIFMYCLPFKLHGRSNVWFLAELFLVIIPEIIKKGTFTR